MSTMTTSIDDLLQRFNQVGIQEKKHHVVDSKLQDVLKESDFTIFAVVKDLGYWGWTPTPGPYKSLDQVTAQEILKQIDARMTPDQLGNISTIQRSLPKPFATYLPPQTHINKYPYAAPISAGLHVAVVKRGVDLDQDVDFCFGGSTLEMLAHQTIEPAYMYLISLVPLHPNVICVSCFREYEYNLSDVGFQFERLVTGKSFTDLHDESDVKHMQILKVGGIHRVMFAAEVDAVTKDGQLVEVKASNPYYWGTKVMFQMISSGSTVLCGGNKQRGTLKSVRLQSLSSVMATALKGSSVSELEGNILDGMQTLKKEVKKNATQLEQGDVMEMYFDGYGSKKTIKLRPVVGKVLYPPDSVEKELAGVSRSVKVVH